MEEAWDLLEQRLLETALPDGLADTACALYNQSVSDSARNVSESRLRSVCVNKTGCVSCRCRVYSFDVELVVLIFSRFSVST